MTTHYTLEGTPNSPVLVFSNSLGTDLSMWDEVVPLLLPYFRILRYDTRGMGKSTVTQAPYTMDQLGMDILNLLDELRIDKFSFCGLSMGGLIGQWIALHYPYRLEKLVLCNTAARIGTIEAWDERIALLEADGMSAIVDQSMKIWFTPEFRETQPDRIAGIIDRFISNKVQGYINCCSAIRDADFREKIPKISSKTLVVTGADDPVTTIEDARFLLEKIPDAQLEILPVRHLSSMEQPAAMSEKLIDFLVGPSSFERGMHVRRTVLGAEHVNRATEQINDFNGDFQNFISRYAWGEIWTRPGLSKPERSMITIAMLTALNRRAELKMHLRAALNNGVSIEVLKEVILHAGIYSGLPTANDAIHLAQEVFDELGIHYN